jgi:hypothetical protein
MVAQLLRPAAAPASSDAADVSPWRLPTCWSRSAEPSSSAGSPAPDDRLGERGAGAREGDTLVGAADGGVGYRITVPAGVAEWAAAAGAG